MRHLELNVESKDQTPRSCEPRDLGLAPQSRTERAEYRHTLLDVILILSIVSNSEIRGISINDGHAALVEFSFCLRRMTVNRLYVT